MIKLLLDKQIFASSDARFCCDVRNNSHYTQNFVHNTHNFSLDMVLSPQYVSMKPRGGGLRSPEGPPLYMKKTSMSNNDFQNIWSKKNWIWKMTLADPPQYGIFHNGFFFNEPFPQSVAFLKTFHDLSPSVFSVVLLCLLVNA